jgi:hypothetical protein
VTWLISNQADEPLRLEGAWVPHGRFRGDGHMPLATEILPGESWRLTQEVTASEAPETVVENAFLIIRLRRRDQAWRVFTRMRIEFKVDGVPVPVVEDIISQSIQ